MTAKPGSWKVALFLSLVLTGCRPAPTPPPAPVETAPPPKPVAPTQFIQRWSVAVPGASALCVGDWDGDGAADVLAADASPALVVIGADGTRKNSVQLPERFTAIECGRGPRLLGYSTWGKQVRVLDGAGKELWAYAGPTGVNGAHWGDLNGDGKDEMIVGMNGFGGLHAVSAEGQLLWQNKNIGNVWNQAVIPAVPARTSLVFATEANGSIRVFDGAGNRLQTLRPNDQYCSQISAAVVDASNTVQLAAIGQGHEAVVVAMDTQGVVAWKAPCVMDRSGWRSPSFASGDLDGDGTPEWVFLGTPGKLQIVSARGSELGSVPISETAAAFAILPASPRGLLVTCAGGTITAYGVE
jgi:hypothetical protein